MSDCSRDVAGYVLPEVPGPVLTSALLTSVRDLNSNFLELLCAELSSPDLPSPELSRQDRASMDPEMGSMQARSPFAEALPDNALQVLGRVDPAYRRAVSNSPFTLYALKFDDAIFWSSVLRHPVERFPGSRPAGTPFAGVASAAAPVTRRYCSPANTSRRASFCQVALFFVWHVLASSRTAARLLFALPDALAEQLRNTPLCQLERAAWDYPGILTPRWASHPDFWPDVVRFAATGDVAVLKRVRLLGNRLTASELSGLLPNPLAQRRLRCR